MHGVEQLDPRQDENLEPIVDGLRPRPPTLVVDHLVPVESGHRGGVGEPIRGHLQIVAEDDLFLGPPRRRVEGRRRGDRVVVRAGDDHHVVGEPERAGAATAPQPGSQARQATPGDDPPVEVAGTGGIRTRHELTVATASRTRTERRRGCADTPETT
jgi:hypothetical protein